MCQITQSSGRRISDIELGQYLDRIIPGVYAEVYGLDQNIRHQILWRVRDELSCWGGLTQTEIDRRVSQGYSHAR